MTTDERDPSLDDRFDPAVRMVAHDAAWLVAAHVERERLSAALGQGVVAVEHVGSTAVPGLVAKPIIDLQVSVPRLEDQASFLPQLEAIGYTFVADPGSADYLLFVRPWRRPRTHHVHVCAVGSAHEARHIAVRDFLRASVQEAEAYGALKRGLVDRAPNDRLAYIAGKDAYVRALEERALAWGALRKG